MKERIQINEQVFAGNQKIDISRKLETAPDSNIIDSNPDILISEVNEGFSQYLEWLGLDKDPKLILSSTHHYYYDAEEMNNVRTVVNLKGLNHIEDIRSFLHSMFLILPCRCYLIGCFTDNKRQSGFSLRKRSSGEFPESKSEEVVNGIASRIPFVNTIFSMLDAKTNSYLSEKSVTQLLRNNGFKVLDMTDLNGTTYFCCQSQRPAGN